MELAHCHRYAMLTKETEWCASMSGRALGDRPEDSCVSTERCVRSSVVEDCNFHHG